MNTNSQASSSNTSYGRRQLPVCGCGSTMRFFISGSEQNPGRPYWKCINWMSKDGCKLFVWNDELKEEHFKFRDFCSIETNCGGISQNQSCKGCEYGEKLLEASTKEKEKLKIKLGLEREIVKGLKGKCQRIQFMLLFSWVLFVVYVAWINEN